MVEQRSVLAYQSHLGGGGTGVNSQKAVTLIIFKAALFDAVAGVAGLELLIGSWFSNSGSMRFTSASIWIPSDRRRMRAWASIFTSWREFMAAPTAANRWE